MSWWASNTPTKHTLTITASPSYSAEDAHVVPVNTESPLHVSSELAEIDLLVRIKDFSGSSEHAADPATCEYFTRRPNTNVSLQLRLTPKSDIQGDKLLFGNDFAYPIKDFLPYGTGAGLKLFTRYVDPSVEGDVYCDEPFLYGKALTSFNAVSDTIEGEDGTEEGGIIEEGVDGEEFGLDVPQDGAQRQTFFREDTNLKRFIFKKGETYEMDFFSGFVSLKGSDILVSLPGGFELNMSRYLNEKFNSVRFVLKTSGPDGESVGVSSGKTLLVVNFELVTVGNEGEIATTSEPGAGDQEPGKAGVEEEVD